MLYTPIIVRIRLEHIKSPVKQATGYYTKGAGSTKAVPQGKRGTSIRGQFPEADEITPDQEKTDSTVFYDDVDATVDDICSDAADALRDVFKTAHSVGRFVRQQLTPKKKKNISAQNSPMTDEKVEQGVVHIDSDSSEEKPGVQPQSMIIDVEDGMMAQTRLNKRTMIMTTREEILQTEGKKYGGILWTKSFYFLHARKSFGRWRRR